MMPTYSFENTKTGEEFDEYMSMDQREIYLEENRHIRQIITKAPPIADPYKVGTKTKPDEGFREVLRNIKKGSDDQCTINTF